MTKHQIGSVWVELSPDVFRKKLSPPKASDVLVEMKNVGLLSVDVLLKTFRSADASIAKVSSSVPATHTIGPRVSKATSAIPRVLSVNVGTWTPADEGDTDLELEVDGERGGARIPNGLSWLSANVTVER